VAVVVLAVLAAGLRLGIGLARLDQVYRFPDSQGYRQLADSLTEGRGLVMTDVAGRDVRAGRMPGYPLILSWLHGAFGPSAAVVVVAQGLLAAVAVWLAWSVGRQVAGPAAGVTAAALIALSPWQVYFATVALTECWATVLLLMAVLCGLRAAAAERRWAAWSLAAGLATAGLIYVHPQSLLLLPLVGLAAAVAPGRGRWLVRWGIVATVCSVALAPWVVRNVEAVGHPVLTTTRLGATWYDGANEQATGASDMRFEQHLRHETDPLDEVAYDAYYRRRAWQAVRDNPRRALALAAVKLRRLWSPTPNLDEGQRPLYRWAGGLAYVPMVGGAILGALVLLRRPAALVLLAAPVVVVSAAAAVMVGSIRYRVPVEPMLFVLAGAAVAWVLRGSDVLDGPQEPRP
jgi:hypothetical protein